MPFWTRLQKYKVRWFLGVPALYRMMLGKRSPGSIRSELPEVLLLRWRCASHGGLQEMERPFRLNYLPGLRVQPKQAMSLLPAQTKTLS